MGVRGRVVARCARQAIGGRSRPGEPHVQSHRLRTGKIISARTQSWPDGKPITVVLRDPSSAYMQLVPRKLTNMTSDQARAFIHAHSAGIVVADSDEAVLRYVSGTRGVVGIIDLYSLTKDVKVLKVDGKLPVEQG